MTSQFSPRVFEVLELSRQEALRLESNIVGPEHLLLGILRGSGGPVNDVFARYETKWLRPILCTQCQLVKK